MSVIKLLYIQYFEKWTSVSIMCSIIDFATYQLTSALGTFCEYMKIYRNVSQQNLNLKGIACLLNVKSQSWRAKKLPSQGNYSSNKIVVPMKSPLVSKYFPKIQDQVEIIESG